MSSTEILTTILLEDQTGDCTFLLVDGSGAGIDKAQLTTMTLTYYDRETGRVINTRENQDILDTNNVTLVTVATIVGLVTTYETTVTWEIQPEDTIIVDDRRELETHIALFQWTWDNGLRHAAHEIQFRVENLLFVP